MKPSPDQFIPAAPADFIGGAARLAAATLKQIARLKDSPDQTLKLCFYGAPGCGKTSLVNLAARALAANRFDIDEVNGRDLTIDRVRDWMQGAAYGSLFGGWRVKIINEMDLVPLAAQDLLLTYLDTLPAGVAVFGTSNEDRATLSQRFCSRFQQVKVASPDQDELAAWLRQRWGIAKKAAAWIALTACGNVREACLQATAFLHYGYLPEEKKAAAPAVCASRSEAAKRAWETMRANGRAVA